MNLSEYVKILPFWITSLEPLVDIWFGLLDEFLKYFIAEATCFDQLAGQPSSNDFKKVSSTSVISEILQE